ncbi:glucose dehydrogenase [FAD, quinone] [Aethina tumida]|uniref:glucose dehydrogenase [FAD, quinone] n=1 Tax=Aethina tumida TaxID=116153 RepID=UPI00096B46B5|nr:glucose dehydrogenase [FAD, quinone] [Aethina tumida]
MLLPLIFTLFCGVQSSPFLLMQKYIEGFQNGLNELHELSHHHQFEEEICHEHEETHDVEEYDFIIVGAGTSGSIIANRLSEVPEWKILVLEAGAPETEFTKVPKMQKYLQTTPYSWGYKTVPQSHSCLGMIDNKCTLENGKALGGSSAINDMLYIRGNPKDYDVWADKDNIGWCWDDVKHTFKKLEDAYIHPFDRKYHKYGGHVHLENPRYTTPHLQEHIMGAAEELGIHTVDYNGKHQMGFGVPQVITKEGKRISSAEAYLEPAVKRENLLIRPESRVVKILISTHTKEATGVKYLHAGKLFVAKARKEVILAAGAINSAQLLMLSGIGPLEDLKKLDIECVSDLEVGKHLKDHMGFNGLNFIYNSSTHDHHKFNNHDDVVLYLRDGKGPLTAVPNEVIGFVKSEASKDPSDYPDLQLSFTPDIFNHGHEHLRYLNIRPDVYDHMWKHLEDYKGFSIIPTLTNPKSRGHMKLHSNNPLHPPLIDLNQLSDEEENDLETLLAGVKIAIKLAQTESMQKLGIHINTHSAPGCDKHKFDTKDFWICQIKHLSYNLRQISGTAKMGPKGDHTAVVDNKLNVYGVHKLRVADASIIPVTITGNYMAVEMMIGEQASDLIKEAWK